MDIIKIKNRRVVKQNITMWEYDTDDSVLTLWVMGSVTTFSMTGEEFKAFELETGESILNHNFSNDVQQMSTDLGR